MSATPEHHLLPAHPVLLGRLSYEAMVEGDTPRELFREEEPFWARLSGLMFDGYRTDVQHGVYFSRFGREEAPAPLRPRPAEADSAQPVTLRQPFELAADVQVAVMRAGGELDPAWTLKSRTPSGQVLVTRASEHGALSKLLSLEELLRHNLHLVPEGLAVQVPRSSGALDPGWRTGGMKGDRLLVEKPGVGRKQLTAEQFVTANREWLGAAGDAVESAVRPSVEASSEARAQRRAFALTHRLEGRLHDGFSDAGRGATLDEDAWPVSARREVLVVDRVCDPALRRHLAYARDLRAQEPLARLKDLVRYVYDQLGGPVGRIEARVVLAASTLRARPLLIGEVDRALGGGLSRHRALLFQVLADEAELSCALVRGAAGLIPGGHAWNEVTLAQGAEALRVLVDLSRLPEQALVSLTDPRTERYYRAEAGGAP
ncbi:MAG TPA: EDR1-related protein [Pantanalinema sp.]